MRLPLSRYLTRLSGRAAAYSLLGLPKPQPQRVVDLLCCRFAATTIAKVPRGKESLRLEACLSANVEDMRYRFLCIDCNRGVLWM